MKYNLLQITLPNFDITIELSNKFSELLYNALGEKEINEIVKKNKIAIEFCASHEYCDSNEYMIDALNYLFGIHWNLSDERITNLINDSWELSIVNEFKQTIKKRETNNE